MFLLKHVQYSASGPQFPSIFRNFCQSTSDSSSSHHLSTFPDPIIKNKFFAFCLHLAQPYIFFKELDVYVLGIFTITNFLCVLQSYHSSLLQAPAIYSQDQSSKITVLIQDPTLQLCHELNLYEDLQKLSNQKYNFCLVRTFQKAQIRIPLPILSMTTDTSLHTHLLTENFKYEHIIENSYYDSSRCEEVRENTCRDNFTYLGNTYFTKKQVILVAYNQVLTIVFFISQFEKLQLNFK